MVSRRRRPPAVTRPVRYTVVAAVVLAASVGVFWLLRGPIELPPPTARGTTSPDAISFDDFVGAEACRDCHAPQYAAWRGSTHGRAGGVPGAVRILAAFDGRAIRFADAVVTPAVTGGRYTFTVAEAGKAPVRLAVTGVVGGGHMVGGGTQGFVSAFPDGTIRFLPFDFIRQEGVWFCNTNTRSNRGWVPITPDMPLAECADWPPSRILGTDLRYANCQECHGSQIEVRFDTAAQRYATRFATLAINCESCHGPGRAHAALARSGAMGRTMEIGMEPLALRSTDGALQVCFGCHALKDVLEPGYLPGRSLERYFSLGLPVVGDRPLFPDGRVRTFAYQENHRYSDCYLNGSMTCTDCHDPHTQSYRDVWGRPLRGRFDDGQCVGCHAAKAARPESHTFPAAGSPGGRCVSCHMPYLQHPEVGHTLRFARSDHTIPIPRPAFDSAMGIVNACSQCHGDRSVAALEVQVRSWYGALKPHKPIVEAGFRANRLPDATAAAAQLLDTTARFPMAQIAAVDQFAERYLRPDVERLEPSVARALRRLAASGDLDLRAVALAALHLARGNDRPTRRVLAAALRTAGAQEPLLRTRWATAIGTFGDRFRAAGDLERAIASYRKALEILPDQPRILSSLGLAYVATRDYDSALAVIGRARDADPYQPFTWVALGVARQGSGDALGAATAYRRAIELKPDEAVPHVNLANLLQDAGRPVDAIPHYERALELDPTNARGYTLLVRAYAAVGEEAKALATVQRAVRLLPDDPLIRQFLEQLRRVQDGGG